MADEAARIVKEKGGEIIVKYRTPLKLREHLSPHKFTLPLREPFPSSKNVLRLEKMREKGGFFLF